MCHLTFEILHLIKSINPSSHNQFPPLSNFRNEFGGAGSYHASSGVGVGQRRDPAVAPLRSHGRPSPLPPPPAPPSATPRVRRRRETRSNGRRDERDERRESSRNEDDEDAGGDVLVVVIVVVVSFLFIEVRKEGGEDGENDFLWRQKRRN